MNALQEGLFEKLELLNGRLWEGRATRSRIDSWLENFDASAGDIERERDHALFLLSQFVYFGLPEVRELLKSLYRDHYRQPIVEAFRRDNEDSTDLTAIDAHFHAALSSTRFLGMGNPAESGTHLLYYFRQENELPNKLFASELQLVDGRYDSQSTRLKDPAVERIVFIDDFCGSGVQATDYSKKLLGLLSDIASRSGIELHFSYLVLVAMADGLDKVRAATDFDHVSAVFELDTSYRSLEPDARQYAPPQTGIEQPFAKTFATTYGSKICPGDPTGYNDSQLLLGFHHNVPDNSLPIIWWDADPAWFPIFPRYQKIYF